MLPDDGEGQLALFGELPLGIAPVGLELPPLAPLPTPPLHDVRRLSYSALALFERCSYRYFAERVLRLPRVAARRSLDAESGGLAGTEIGDAVHRLLEEIPLDAPAPPARAELETTVRAWYATVNESELDRIAGLVEAYCRSPLALRIATLAGARPERPFAFEHDGVLLHGRLDVLWRENGNALVVDYKSNLLDGADPHEIVDADYRLQRLVYALACLRDGAHEVEVAYQFLERPDDVVSATFSADDLPELEAELSEAISRIRAGVFVPTPSEFACADCPALDLVCAGPGSARGTGRRGRAMRVAALNDVHGNLPALDAVLGEVAQAGVDTVVCGGDVVGGSFPVEVLDRLLILPDVRFVRGNVDRLVLEGVAEHGQDWSAERLRLGDDRLATIAGWPLTVELEIDGVGSTLFCHATPTADEPIFTRVTPDEDVVRLIGDVDADLVVCGHTHMQFDRQLPGGLRVVNAGSVGMPYEGRRGAFWALLGPSIELRHTEYDVDAAVASFREAAPWLREQLTGWLLDPRDPDEATAVFEAAAWRVATSARLGAGVSDGDVSGSGRSSNGSQRSTPTRRSRFVSAPRSSCSSR